MILSTTTTTAKPLFGLAALVFYHEAFLEPFQYMVAFRSFELLIGKGLDDDDHAIQDKNQQVILSTITTTLNPSIRVD